MIGTNSVLIYLSFKGFIMCFSVYGCFAYVYIAYHMCAVPVGQKRVLMPWGLALQVVVSHLVGAGN